MKAKHEKKQDLQGYIDQLTKDTKPILTYADIDEKIKSGSFQRTVFSQIPKPLRIILSIIVIGSILYGLVQEVFVNLEFLQ